MQTSTSYLDRVVPALGEVAGRFAQLARTADDPEARVPTSPDWTVRQAVMHVVTVAPRYAAGPEGRGRWAATPDLLPALNDDEIRALGAPSMAELADRLGRDLAALCEQIRGYGVDAPAFRFHGGGRIAADQALGILLGELVVHGHDVAGALGRPWAIDPGHAELFAWGRRPWLAFTLPSRFHKP